MVTKLEAVNEILEIIGEPEFLALDTAGTSIASEAERMLDREGDRIQKKGWFQNQEFDFTIQIATLKIAVSGGAGTFLFDEDVTESVSGAVGRFKFEETGEMFLVPTTGTFTGGKTLTGAVSAATRDGAAAIVLTESKIALDPTWTHIEPWETEEKRFVQFGSFLRDVRDQTLIFTRDVTVELIQFLDFLDLTEKLQEYIVKATAKKFQRFKKRGAFDERIARDEELEARTLADQEDGDLRDDNVLQTNEARRLKGSRRTEIINIIDSR